MISVNSVYKTYSSGSEVLRGLSLVCERGNIYTLVGKNGTGKSTLINSMAGLIPVNKGKIEIMGQEVNPGHRSALRSVGFVFEEHSLIEKFTAKEQLEFIAGLYKLKNSKSRIEYLVELLELPTDSSKYIESYSYGTISKIAIACALIHSPDILILDEPFRGLDIPTSNKLFEYLKKYVAEGKCAFITTHEVNIISELSDFVLILNKGQIRSVFSFSELMEKSSVYSGERNPLGTFLERCLD